MDRLEYRQAREKAGYRTQRELAIKLGMNYMTYCSKENYEAQFKADELLKFCDIVGVDPKNLKIKGYNY